MLESLQGRGVPRQFVISRQSGNVTFVPSWTSQLTPVLVCVIYLLTLLDQLHQSNRQYWTKMRKLL